MSLLIKSKQNHTAFIYLREQGKRSDLPEQKCNSPAVHCCYYSCFQKVVHILKEFFPESYESINLKDKNTHNHAVNHFLGEVRERLTDKTNLSKLRRCLTELRALRVKCDYSDTLITDLELEKAEQYLTTFHQTVLKELSI